MRLNKLILTGIVFAAAACLFHAQARAEVKIDSEFEGTLVITFPDGDIELLEKGEKMPDIPTDSILEIFDGRFSVATGNADHVQVACLDHGASAAGAASISLACGEASGLLKINAGTVMLTTPTGESLQLGAGDEYVIQLVGAGLQPAPPTAEGQGRQVARGLREGIADPPVDPRGIEASPAA